MPDISVIIVNYNVKEFVGNLLNSIKSALDGLSTEIFVVDNASDDGSPEYIREHFPEVRLIANNKNAGFGKANNQALAVASGKYLLIINPDTIVQEDTLHKMIGFFSCHPEAGMAGCRVLNPDGSLQLACRRGFPGPWTSFCKFTGLSKLFPKSRLFARYNLTYLDENSTHEVDAISGSFMMMPRDVYIKTGGFDPQFFMYGEDLDLCYRVQKSGYKVYYVHETSIIHYKGESTRRSSIDETRIFYEAMHLFVKKHFASSFLVVFLLRCAIFLRTFLAVISAYKLPVILFISDFILFDIVLYSSEKIYISHTWRGFPAGTLWLVFTVPALAQAFTALFTGAYEKDRASVIKCILSLFFGFFVVSSLTYFFKQYAYSRAIILITFSLLAVLLPLCRVAAKLLFSSGNSGKLKRPKTLIVGTSTQSAELIEKMKRSVQSMRDIEGVISLTQRDNGTKIGKYEVVGSLDNIAKIIAEKKITEVIFASDDISYNSMLSAVSKCTGLNAEFKLAGRDLDYLVGKSSVAALNDIPLLDVHYNISLVPMKAIKFAFDKAFAIFLLLLYIPALLGAFIFRKCGTFRFILSAWKVLFADYSFVGPRERSTVNGLYIGKKGLTGLWFTEDDKFLDPEEESKLDIYYARNQNLWFDLEILGKTLGKFMRINI
jgi:GT2 family glycosyltransferase